MKQTIPNKRIVLVDDDPTYRQSLVRLFPAFQFLHAGTVQEALHVLDQNPDVQVVLLDLRLDGESGTALLDAIRDRMDKYRVIVLTAYQSLLDAAKAEEYGVYSYVAKTQGREALLFHLNDAFAAIENAWLTKKVDVHLEILRKVNQLGVGANADPERDLREALGLICERAVELLGAYTCHVRLLDPARGDFELWASKGRVKEAEKFFEDRVPPKRAYSALAADRRERLIIDLETDDEFQTRKAKNLSNPEIDPAYREYLNRVASACVDPISTSIFGEDIDAVFNINSDEKTFFSAAEKLELVDDFVSQTNLAVTKYRLKKKRKDLHDDYRNIGDMLEEISNEFIGGEDQLEKIYRIVFKRIAKGIGPELISIFLFDETSRSLKNVAEYRGNKWVGPTEEQFLPGRGIVGRVYTSGTVTFDIRRDSTGKITSKLPVGYAEEKLEDKLPSGDLKHYLAAPIKFNNNTIGVIRLVNKISEEYDSAKIKSLCLLQRGFSEDCLTELEITGNHLGATIKNAELIGELSRKVSQIEYVYKVGEAIGFGQDMDAAFDLVVRSVADVLKAEICMLFKMNERGDRIELSQISGMPPIEGAYYEVGKGKTGTVAKTKQPVLESKAEKHDGRYNKEIVEHLRKKHGPDHNGIESFMAVPLEAKGEVLGVIKIINKLEPPFEFGQKDLDLFRLFHSQIGLERFLYTQRYLKNVVENSPVPIIFLKNKGIVEIFNKACEQLWGLKSEDVIGRSVIDLYISGEEARRIGAKLKAAPGHRIHNVEAQIKDHGGNEIPVLLSATTILDGDRQIGSLGVFKDLREIRRFEELQDALGRSEREAVIGKVAHTAGHDIKHNVGMALNYLEIFLLETDPNRDDELRQIYSDMEVALQEAMAQLKNVLDAVLPDPLERKRVQVKEIFANKIDTQMRRQASARKVNFVLNCANEDDFVLVDIKHIQGLLWNLFDNSLDAIEKRAEEGSLAEPGLIEFSVMVKNGNLRFVWKDNGCGIAKADTRQIFQPHYTNKPKGTGLGLFSVKKCVRNHDGQIQFESVEGEGTTFSVTIPVPRD